MHVAHINFFPAPIHRPPEDTLEQWHSLVDVAEAAAGAWPRVSVIQAAGHPAHLTRNGIGYHFVDVGALRSAAHRSRGIVRLVESLGADVVHVHGLGFAEEAFTVSQHLPSLPILLQDHADRVPRWWRHSHWRRWYTAATGAAFTSLELAHPFTTSGLIGPQTQLFAIPESSSRFTCGSRAHAWAETGLHGSPCVVWVGHLSAGKDPLTVLDGVAMASMQCPNIQLWCAFGNAPMLEQVQRRIAGDPRLSGRVHLLGRVPHAHIQSLMRAADLFVSGSLRESCGYAALEAMACGVVPVVTDIPSFRETTSKVGFLWSRGDASALADALVRAAAKRPTPEEVRAHFDAFLSFEAVGRRLASAYARLLGSQPGEAS